MNATTHAELIAAAHAANNLFPDLPLGKRELQYTSWNANAGKPFTLPEKNRIFGKAPMCERTVTKLESKAFAHTNARVKHTTRFGPAPAPEPEPAAIPVTVDESPAPRYTAIVALACSGCGSHEIDYDGPASGTCAECGCTAEMDPFVLYGPSYRDYLIHVEGERRRQEAIAHAAQPRVIAGGLTCHSCGAPAEQGDRFCGQCGARLTHEATAHESPYTTDVENACRQCGSRDWNLTQDGYCRTCMDWNPPPPPERTNDAGCGQCGTIPEPADRFCGQCGHRLTVFVDPAPQDVKTCERCGEFMPDAWIGNVCYACNPRGPLEDTAQRAYAACAGFIPIREKYHGKNPERILSAMPHATDVRGFGDWLKVGRCVRKAQKGIQIYTPAGGPGEDADGVIDERRPRVKRAYVFDISQTAPIAPRELRGRPCDSRTYAAAD
jgi:hypothetical protein